MLASSTTLSPGPDSASLLVHDGASATLSNRSSRRSSGSSSAPDACDGTTQALHPSRSPASSPHPRPPPAAREVPGDGGGSTWQQRLQAFVLQHFLILALTLAVIVALTWPHPGRTVNSWRIGNIHVVQALNNVVVFLISGLTLRTADVRSALRMWPALLFGILAILVATPCLGFATRLLPLEPPEFAVGLTIFCAVPTTLGVGVVLVGAARGNQALALLLTVSTNLLGIATVPFVLRLVLSGYSGLQLDPVDLCIKLVLTVLVPTTAGKLASHFSATVAASVQAHRTPLSLFSTTNLVVIMWQTLSSARDQILDQRPLDILAVMGCAVGQHLLLLLCIAACLLLLRPPPREGVALLIMSAQKSAPVAVAIISYATSDSVQQGLLAVPALCGQVAQILIGSLLAGRLAAWMKQQQLDRDQG